MQNEIIEIGRGIMKIQHVDGDGKTRQVIAPFTEIAVPAPNDEVSGADAISDFQLRAAYYEDTENPLDVTEIPQPEILAAILTPNGIEYDDPDMGADSAFL